MPSEIRNCCFPRCSARRIENEYRGRIIQTKYKKRVTAHLWEQLVACNGGDFILDEKDEVCSKCEAMARNHTRTKVQGKWVHQKRQRLDQPAVPAPTPLSAISSGSELIHESFINDVAEIQFEIEMSVQPGSEIQIEKENRAQISMASCGNGMADSESQTAPSCVSTTQSNNSQLFSTKDIEEGKARIHIPGISSVKYTEKACFICHNTSGRSRVPYRAVIDVWVQRRIFIPPRNRCCKIHLSHGIFDKDSLAKIEAEKSYAVTTGVEISRWMQVVTDQLQMDRNLLNFEPASRLTDTDFDMLLGLSKLQFEELFSYVAQDLRSTKLRSARSALAIVLMKLRLNMSQRILAFLFQLPHQSYVSKIMKTVVQLLNKAFIPSNIGFQHISRQSLMEQHMRPFYSKILGLPSTAFVAVLDGTYIYIQKSSNHEFQRMTFCGYKMRNLLKPMMIVAPDGYIISAEGLYFSNHGNNDSTILKEMLLKPHNILSILQPGDATLVDRGFQTVQEEVESHGLRFFMPALLAKKQAQFSTEQANRSRKVTILRYIVELANGRLKNKFRFFDDRVPAGYLSTVQDLFQLACALLNSFTSTFVQDTGFHEKLVDIVDRRMDKPNLLEQKVAENKWDTRRVIWEPADQYDLLGFPTLSYEDLKELTLGEYQLNMGMNYNMEHLRADSSYTFHVHQEEPGVIRVQLRSRYSSRTRRVLWIQFEDFVNGVDGILEWYCKCPIGARTVGCCSHVAAVLRFLGHDRFLDTPTLPNICDRFLDAASNILNLMDDSDSGSDSEDEEDGQVDDEEAYSEEVSDVM